MARPSVAARNLSLTEELEKIEQSITLTLQEIDHNFSKSHRIVTSSILPLVEQYGEHSRAVWEASKFWKQFFEASANVSLSGYEDVNKESDSSVVEESTAMRDDTEVEQTPRRNDDTSETDEEHSRYQDEAEGEESLLDDAELSGSTPRPPATKITKAQVAKLDSPYETMKREMRDEDGGQTTVLEDDDSSILFAQQTARLPDMTMTPRSLLERQTSDQSVQRSKDPLLHRVLDKNYRIQATPHKPATRVSPSKGKESAKANVPSWQQDSPMSSPEIAAPKLRSQAFMSPHKSNARARLAAATQQKAAPRTPGVSVQTPATARKTRNALDDEGEDKIEIDWGIGGDVSDDDIDIYAGMSPPKTMTFALAPSKLLQTPAQEASRRIVGDILMNAGADPESSEYSPTMVKMNADILDDSF